MKIIATDNTLIQIYHENGQLLYEWNPFADIKNFSKDKELWDIKLSDSDKELIREQAKRWKKGVSK